MPSSVVCVGASLTLKLIFPEPDGDDANRLWENWLSTGTVIIAPTLWAYEVTSFILNRTRRGLLDPDLEQEAIINVHKRPVRLMAPRGLHQLAWQFARQFDRPAAYDPPLSGSVRNGRCPILDSGPTFVPCWAQQTLQGTPFKS